MRSTYSQKMKEIVNGSENKREMHTNLDDP